MSAFSKFKYQSPLGHTSSKRVNIHDIFLGRSKELYRLNLQLSRLKRERWECIVRINFNLCLNCGSRDDSTNCWIERIALSTSVKQTKTTSVTFIVGWKAEIIYVDFIQPFFILRYTCKLLSSMTIYALRAILYNKGNGYGIGVIGTWLNFRKNEEA